MTSTLAGVVVVDGPQVNSDPSPDWLFVAFDGVENSGAPAVDATQSLMAFQRVKGEDASITCAVVCDTGEDDSAAVRARILGILGAAESLLRANMQLGGLVMHAYVSAYQYYPAQTTSGSTARVVFTVTYKAQL
jgi:hypothetical protein